MVRSIGADHVIDYTQEDFTKSGQQYDLILDIAAKGSVSDYKHALSPKGIYVLTGFTMAAMFGVLFLGPRISKNGDKKFVNYGAKPNNKDLVFIKELIEAGKERNDQSKEKPDNALHPTAIPLRFITAGVGKNK